MADTGQDMWVRVVNPGPTRSERHRALAAAVRGAAGAELNASDMLGEFPTANAAKSFANRVNRGHLAAFHDPGFHARTRGCEVSISYYLSPNARREAS